MSFSFALVLTFAFNFLAAFALALTFSLIFLGLSEGIGLFGGAAMFGCSFVDYVNGMWRGRAFCRRFARALVPSYGW